MQLSQFLESDRVVVKADAHSKKRALEQLSELLAQGQDTVTASQVFTALIQRERLGCTSLGFGVALPHAQISGLSESVGAFMQLEEPIAFDSGEDDQVSMIFGLLVPESAGDENMYNLSNIATLFMETDLRHRLHGAKDALQTFTTLIEARLPPPQEMEASG